MLCFGNIVDRQGLGLSACNEIAHSHACFSAKLPNDGQSFERIDAQRFVKKLEHGKSDITEADEGGRGWKRDFSAELV